MQQTLAIIAFSIETLFFVAVQNYLLFCICNVRVLLLTSEGRFIILSP